MQILLTSALAVRVVDPGQKILKEADIILTHLSGREKSSAVEKPLFNKRSGIFTFEKLTPGNYRLRVACDGYETQKRNLTLNSGDHAEEFILGKNDMLYYYRGKVAVPFHPLSNLFGIIIKKDKRDGPLVKELKDRLKKMGITEKKTHKNFPANGLLLLEYPSAVNEETKIEHQLSLSRNPAVLLIGPLLSVSEKSASLLTDKIIVKFKQDKDVNAIGAIARDYHLTLVRNIPYAGNTYLFSVPGPITFKILDICHQLVNSGLVEYAESDLWHTIENDSITPSDWLFPDQWDHPIINTPGAWQALAGIDPLKTFGDPDIIIALMDTGIDSSHPNFNGLVTNGNLKIYQLFDFTDMVNNTNDHTDGAHGSGTAGGATGLANNLSSVPGFYEGTAGVAGNCRLIACRYPDNQIESNLSDAYIWIAGFDPKSTLPGFPARITPGADIISNSFGFSSAPISGLMADTFDYLTTYGRDGKGVVLFYSAGNDDEQASLERPWGLYPKCHSVTASTLDPLGNEVRASYSNFGPGVSFCAPSDSGGGHNPPASYGAFSSTIEGQGNLPGRPSIQISLIGAVVAGTSVLKVSSTTGIVAGQSLLISKPGSPANEAAIISAVDPVAVQITIATPTLSSHPTGTAIFVSSSDYINNFGGTSYATPVCAGLAALILSANPDLNWLQVRQIMRGTAVKIDPANNDPVGEWQDQNGLIASDPGYLGPFFSQWYGYGRIDAEAAVIMASNFFQTGNAIVRDNLSDIGIVPTTGSFWDSPDVWVRNLSPGADGAAALPANYASAPPHQDTIRGQDNWVYVRLKNIGSAATGNFYVRVYIAHWPGTEFVFPDNFIPTPKPGGSITSPLTPGTYLIGESSISSQAIGAETIISMQWAAAEIPPAYVITGALLVHWHPCLLVQVTPFDGPSDGGNHVWDSDNLAQKNITIVNLTDDAVDDIKVAVVIGNKKNPSRILDLEIDRQKLPSFARLYIDIQDAKAMDWIEKKQVNKPPAEKKELCELTVLQKTRAVLHYGEPGNPGVNIALDLAKDSTIGMAYAANEKHGRGNYFIGRHQGRKVVFLDHAQKVRIPMLMSAAQLTMIVVGVIIDERPAPGSYDIVLNQYDYKEIISGSYGIQINVK